MQVGCRGRGLPQRAVDREVARWRRTTAVDEQVRSGRDRRYEQERKATDFWGFDGEVERKTGPITDDERRAFLRAQQLVAGASDSDRAYDRRMARRAQGVLAVVARRGFGPRRREVVAAGVGSTGRVRAHRRHGERRPGVRRVSGTRAGPDGNGSDPDGEPSGGDRERGWSS
jgi:peptidoglycan hydrolase-like protein with peptidoglycan-binding domain